MKPNKTKPITLYMWVVCAVATVLMLSEVVGPLMGLALDGEAARQDNESVEYVDSWTQFMDGTSEFSRAANGMRE